jgi:hypothetical protein
MIEKIVEELHKQDLVKKLLRKKSVWDGQTIYGDLNDYMRDMYDLSLHDREIVVERLLGKYVIHNIYDVVL